MPANSRSILLCSSDPGGTNAVAALHQKIVAKSEYKADHFVDHLGMTSVRGVRTPQVLPKDSQAAELIERLQPEKIITGTSFRSNFELEVIREAKARKIPVASIVDHWVGYRDRFGRNGVDTYPDEIWLPDDNALLDSRKAGYPEDRLKVFGNPYLEYISNYILRLRSQKDTGMGTTKKILLFLSDAHEETGLGEAGVRADLGYTEYDVIGDLLETLAQLIKEGAINGTEWHVQVKLHPREVEGKYDKILAAHCPVDWGSGKGDLLEWVSASSACVGMCSMAILEAELLGVLPLRYEPGALYPNPLQRSNAPRVLEKSKLKPALNELLHNPKSAVRPGFQCHYEILWDFLNA